MPHMRTTTGTSVDEFAGKVQCQDTAAVDLRPELEFAASHLPDSFSLLDGGLEHVRGLFIPEDARLLLVTCSGYPGGKGGQAAAHRFR